MTIKTLAMVLPLVAAGCGIANYTPMRFETKGDMLIATGATDGTTMALFQAAMARNPDIHTLVLQNVSGSADDEANLLLGDEVRQAGLATVIPADGLAASGGVDLFLAGVQRALEPGACVGVHGWSDNTGDVEAVQFPRSDPAHQAYLDYYARVGAQKAFYWFTLDAAPASEMHWMTAAEAQRFGIATLSGGELSDAAVCNQR